MRRMISENQAKLLDKQTIDANGTIVDENDRELNGDVELTGNVVISDCQLGVDSDGRLGMYFDDNYWYCKPASYSNVNTLTGITSVESISGTIEDGSVSGHTDPADGVFELFISSGPTCIWNIGGTVKHMAYDSGNELKIYPDTATATGTTGQGYALKKVESQVFKKFLVTGE